MNEIRLNKWNFYALYFLVRLCVLKTMYENRWKLPISIVKIKEKKNRNFLTAIFLNIFNRVLVLAESIIYDIKIWFEKWSRSTPFLLKTTYGRRRIVILRIFRISVNITHTETSILPLWWDMKFILTIKSFTRFSDEWIQF